VRGRIAVDGCPAPRGARGRVAYLPQHDGIDAAFPFSVRDVLASAGRPRADEDAALADVGAAALADRRFDRLSGGERRRALIARTLLLGKPLYLLDEPTAALDAASVPDVYAAIARRVRAHGAAALVVAHDVDAATAVADRVYRIADGAFRASPAEAVR
jgi:ABC-type Mn2+/Zn2+ transport system ATPase subunit